MSARLVQRLRQAKKGITGIETAIILIAFVIVAAVFSYAVLSAGLFSSQKSQEAVYKGIEEAQATTKLLGAIVAKAENPGDTGYISQLTFTISNALGGAPVDFTPPNPDGGNTGLAAAGSPNKVVVSYVDPYQKKDDLFWTLTKVGKCNADNMLDGDEQFQITVGSDNSGQNGGNLVNVLAAHHLGINTKFTLQITTPIGATLICERTTPPYIYGVLSLR
jgi:archaeal flagellin FlaB